MSNARCSKRIFPFTIPKPKISFILSLSIKRACSQLTNKINKKWKYCLERGILRNILWVKLIVRTCAQNIWLCFPVQWYSLQSAFAFDFSFIDRKWSEALFTTLCNLNINYVYAFDPSKYHNIWLKWNIFVCIHIREQTGKRKERKRSKWTLKMKNINKILLIY